MKLKLKIRVTSKDFTLFVLFCIVLLYFSSIAVLNLFSVINDGELYGFNPIEGFSFKYLPATLLVFFGVLIFVFASVSSTIFERVSGGPGLKIGEHASDGYSRWLEEKEMKKAFKIVKVGVQDEDATAGGVVFINDGKNMWVDNSENHTLVVGVTGSGKTTAVIDPMTYSLAKAGESMIFTDPKGEIYRNHGTFLKHKGYNIIILNFRNPQQGNSWNPLTIPYRLYKAGNTDKAQELVDDVASNIMKDKNSQADPFWQDSAADYLAGNILGLMDDATEEECNISSVNYMTTVGEDKFGGNSTYIKEYFKMKGESSPAYVFANNTITAPSDTKGSILSTFRQKIRIFAARKNLAEMLSFSDFDMESIGKQKTAVFIIVQDEKTTYHALASIFIKQSYETLIDVAQNSPGSKLPVRTNYLLDEFANMPAIKDITTMVTAARSRAIRFTFIIQNYAQLDEVYGKEESQTIRSNCANLMYLLTTELSALEEISKLCGEVKSKKDDKTASVPLITVSDLQKLQPNEVIIIRNRMFPFRTKLRPSFSVDWGDKEWTTPCELPTREERDIKLFDIRKFVDVRARSRKNDSPFGSGRFGSGTGGFNQSPFSTSSKPSFADILSGGMSNLNSGSSNPFNKSVPSFDEFYNDIKDKPTKPKSSFDLDAVIKNIDKEIARLEEEEKKEKKDQIEGIGNKNIPLNPFNDTKDEAKEVDFSSKDKDDPTDINKEDNDDIDAGELIDFSNISGNKISFDDDKKDKKDGSNLNNNTKVVNDFNNNIELYERHEVKKPTIHITPDNVSEFKDIDLSKNNIDTSRLSGIEDPTKTYYQDYVKDKDNTNTDSDNKTTNFSDLFKNNTTPAVDTKDVKPIKEEISKEDNEDDDLDTLDDDTDNNKVNSMSNQSTNNFESLIKANSVNVNKPVVNPNNIIKVDNDAKVIKPKNDNDDEYYDDFFSEN